MERARTLSVIESKSRHQESLESSRKATFLDDNRTGGGFSPGGPFSRRGTELEGDKGDIQKVLIEGPESIENRHIKQAEQFWSLGGKRIGEKGRGEERGR